MDIFVTSGITPARGILKLNALSAPCALGHGGVAKAKTEGDGITPAGAWPVRRIWYRPDREPPPVASLEICQIDRKRGWCDDIKRAEYNRPVTLPFDGSHEVLWREDGLYDIFLELGFNDAPPCRQRAALFFCISKKMIFSQRLAVSPFRADNGAHFIAHHAQQYRAYRLTARAKYGRAQTNMCRSQRHSGA